MPSCYVWPQWTCLKNFEHVIDWAEDTCLCPRRTGNPRVFHGLDRQRSTFFDNSCKIDRNFVLKKKHYILGPLSLEKQINLFYVTKAIQWCLCGLIYMVGLTVCEKSARISRDSTAKTFVIIKLFLLVYRAVLQCWHTLRFIYSFVTPCMLDDDAQSKRNKPFTSK